MYCPICQTKVKEWLRGGPHVNRFCRCPKCSSFERHRAFYLVLKKFELAPPANTALRCVSVATEKCFKRRFDSWYFHHATDLHPKADSGIRRMDMTKMPYPDNSIDLVYHQHVLEHIRDDQKAINEIYRVLVPGGRTVFSLPIYPGKTKHNDKPSAHGHWRGYGTDDLKAQFLLAGFREYEQFESDPAIKEEYNLGGGLVLTAVK